MIRAALVVALGVVVGARAASADPEQTLAQVREHFARGEYAEAKTLLETEYAENQAPALLFALGQVEFNLGHFDAAIADYDRFLATNPDADQTALAHQAIGAARARIAAPAPKPPPPPPPPPEYHRRWTLANTGGVVLGGVAIAGGGALLYRGHRLGYDDSGTLAEYDRRVTRAHRDQRLGLACGIGGVALVAAAVIVFGVHEEEVPRVAVTANGVAFGGFW